MKSTLYISALAMILCMFACTEPYDNPVHSDYKVLVVDGFLNNRPGSNYVSLSLASSYDGTGAPEHISNALVFATDNTDSVFMYMETSPGYYKPVDTSFAGRVNKTYTLTVKTPDGPEYVSKPEIMMPLLAPANVYGGYNQVEQLVVNQDGTTKKTVKDVCEIYCDFESDDQVTPRFRFTTSHLVEYMIDKLLNPPENGVFGYTFYCWITGEDNSLRFTNEKYPSGSGEVIRQTVSAFSAGKAIEVPDMDVTTLDYADTVIQTPEYKRIVRIHQYRLNSDSYSWYKGVESQSAAEGKIFDPMTAQLKGNIYCASDPAKTVLGFFEVSSVSARAYAVAREVIGGPVSVVEVPDVFPNSEGFTVDTIPGFWIW
jgi:hypothetical protein